MSSLNFWSDPLLPTLALFSSFKELLFTIPVCLQKRWHIFLRFHPIMALEPNASGGQVRRSFLMPNTPGYNTAAMEMQVQPPPAFSRMPLCDEEDGRTSTTPTRKSSPKNESLEHKHPRIVRWSRIALCVSRIAISILLVAVGAAIVGCEGHALQYFHATNLGAQFFLPLWPQNLDLTPTITILVVGGVILTFNLIYLISAAIPYVCPPNNLQET